MGEFGSAVGLTRIQEKSSLSILEDNQQHDDESIDSNNRDGADDL